MSCEPNPPSPNLLSFTLAVASLTGASACFAAPPAFCLGSVTIPPGDDVQRNPFWGRSHSVEDENSRGPLDIVVHLEVAVENGSSRIHPGLTTHQTRSMHAPYNFLIRSYANTHTPA